MIELDPGQIAVIGFVALIIAEAFRLWKTTTGTDFDRVAMTWILFGVSLVLAFVFVLPSLPAMPVFVGPPDMVVSGVVEFLTSMVTVISAIAGVGMLVYAVLSKAVFDKLALRSLKRAVAKKKAAKK